MNATDKRLNAQMVPGTRVKMSGKFLRNTGQMTGREGQRIWTVQTCPCKQCAQGEWVLTDEKTDTSHYTAEELAQYPYLHFRHIARGNLVIYGKVSSRNCP